MVMLVWTHYIINLYAPFIHLRYHIYTYVHPLYIYISYTCLSIYNIYI
jgi:hypothetical protein